MLDTVDLVQGKGLQIKRGPSIGGTDILVRGEVGPIVALALRESRGMEVKNEMQSVWTKELG